MTFGGGTFDHKLQHEDITQCRQVLDDDIKHLKSLSNEERFRLAARFGLETGLSFAVTKTFGLAKIAHKCMLNDLEALSYRMQPAQLQQFNEISGLLAKERAFIDIIAEPIAPQLPSPSVPKIGTPSASNLQTAATTRPIVASGMLQISKQELAQFIKINPTVSTTLQTVGESALSKALEVCKINPIARLEQGALLDLKTMAQKIAVLESNPQWIKLATDSQLGCMTPQSINKAYAHVQQTAVSGNTLTQVASPQSATAAAAAQPNVASANQLTHQAGQQVPSGQTNNSVSKNKTGKIPYWEQPTKIESYRSDAWKSEHIFSTKHQGRDILKLGNNEEEIISKLKKIVTNLNENGAFVVGDNQVHTSINGYDITLKVHIQNKIGLNINAWMGRSSRVLGKLIEYESGF